MHTLLLVRRGLAYHWRTNLAVVAGVAVAVAVLAGALLVGDSVRASLRGLFLQRLGRAELVVTSANFFREGLADAVRSDAEFARAGFDSAAPLVLLEGVVTREEGGARAAGVQVYGVDERFWRFHGVEADAPRGDEVLLSPALAEELRAAAGETLLLRVEKPSDIPVESLHGRKEDVGRTTRLTVRETLPGSRMGEFSVRPSQSAVRAVFVALKGLQRGLEQEGRANAMLASAREPGGAGRSERLGAILKNNFALEDLGVRLRALEDGRGLSLESETALVNDALAAAAREAADASGARLLPVLSYLANSIRANGREVPYSLVTAVGDEAFEDLRSEGGGEGLTAAAESSPPPLILNEWAASELGAGVGDRVTLEYYLWQESGRLATETAEFRLAGVVPVEGLAADRELVPEYPGITEARSLADWDPPFPVDLSRIRPQDEDYWDEHRTTPKAFVTLGRGQQLWQSRFGKLTSVRVLPPEGVAAEAAVETYGKHLRAALDPTRAGMAVFAARAEGLEAAQGATDFGEYFLYFSFFLVASALMLAALFFRLGVEQRLREIGVLRAVGFTIARVRRIFLAEALALAALGSALGLAGAYAYGELMMHGLRTWWVEAVGTTALALHPTARSFALGALGGVAAALACIVWTLGGLRRASARGLLAGVAEREGGKAGRGEGEKRRGLRRFIPSPVSPPPLLPPVLFALLGVALLSLAAAGAVGQVAGFFGGGTLLLVALLWLQSVWLRRGRGASIGGAGWRAVSRLGARNATHRPGRSLLCVTLIASAAFIIVAVDAFRREGEAARLEPKSGSGGYPLLAETLLPVVHDPNTPAGRDALNLAGAGEEVEMLGRVTFARFRLRPGDDASCLNLYRPRQPRVLAPTPDFLRAGRFAFAGSLAATREEEANPWLLLEREFADGAVPVAADANSLNYVLHLKVGDDFLLERGAGQEPARLRVVAALSDSVFQGELLMSEPNFLRLFPEQEGYRFFLLDLPAPERSAEVSAALEDRLSDFGFDALPTAERLASFHRVENTFLSTFQMLGGLGLALGTLGLAAVLLRNVLERRRELALLRAVGYRRAHFALMVLAENALLLFCGLVTGTACALLAVVPVVASRGGRLPLASLAALLLAVVVSGLLASLLATAAALRSPLLASLRAE
ncbi:MAG TPA: ABC transporter permease [Pyrinomonadaceae bacterium]|nr:ABC transporter permease [Pyrinomonadaceae bacterium]